MRIVRDWARLQVALYDLLEDIGRAIADAGSDLHWWASDRKVEALRVAEENDQ